VNPPRSVGHLEQVSCEADEVLEPQGLESQLGAEGPKFIRDLVFEKIVAGHDGDGRGPVALVLAKSAQEPKAVDERHAEVEDDGIRMPLRRFSQAVFGAHRGPDGVAFKTEHPGKCLRHALIVVDDEDLGCSGFGQSSGHTAIVT